MHVRVLLTVIALALVVDVSGREGRIFLIRHGEKNGKARATGDLHLSQRGEVRAVALAKFFFPNNTDTGNTGWDTFDRPVFNSVIAQGVTDSSPSYRKVETAEPIAREGGLEMLLFDHENIHGLAEHLRREHHNGKNTITVWDHGTIGYVASTLLNVQEGAIRWPMDRYDVIWEVDLENGTLIQYCQHLLFGDLWCPINPLQVYPPSQEYIRSMNAQTEKFPMMQ